MKIITRSERETRQVARVLGSKLVANDCLALWGDFGSGKTVFVKGLASGLRVRPLRDVASPSFVILKIYQGRLPLYHFDFYRLGRAGECASVGLDEFLAAGGVVAIEWPQKARDVLPKDSLEIKFQVLGPTRRSLSFKAASLRHQKIVKQLIKMGTSQ